MSNTAHTSNNNKGYAHYHQGKGIKQLSICRTSDIRTEYMRIEVVGKAHAKKLCKSSGWEPWNF